MFDRDMIFLLLQPRLNGLNVCPYLTFIMCPKSDFFFKPFTNRFWFALGTQRETHSLTRLVEKSLNIMSLVNNIKKKPSSWQRADLYLKNVLWSVSFKHTNILQLVPQVQTAVAPNERKISHTLKLNRFFLIALDKWNQPVSGIITRAIQWSILRTLFSTLN